MVLNVDIEFIPREIPSGKAAKYDHEDLYTVHVDSKRILTVVTDDDETAAKWFQSLLKSTTGSNTKPMDPAATSFRSDSIFVGLIAETESLIYDTNGLRQTPYELLTVCAGSHCLIYDVPEAEVPGYYYPRQSGPPKLVKAFFQNPRVVVFGKDMAKVAKRLEEKHGIQIKNPVDLNELAEKGMERPDLDLGRYDLDRLAMFVLGKHFDVYRPEKKIYWENWRRYRTASDESHFPEYYYPRYTEKKIQFTTLDAYLFLLIGLAVLEHKVDVAAATGSKKKKAPMKKKLNKKSSG